MVIFAATQGFLDELEVPEIRGWETGFLEYMRAQEPGVGQAIRDEKEISDETDAALRKAIEFYAGVFGTGGAAGSAEAEEAPAEAMTA